MFSVNVYKFKHGIKRQYRYDSAPQDLLDQASLLDPFMVSKQVSQWFYDEETNVLGLIVPWVKDIGIYGDRFAVTKCEFHFDTGKVFYEQYFKEDIVELPTAVADMTDDVKINQYSVLVDPDGSVIEYSAYILSRDIGIEEMNTFAVNNSVELNEDSTDTLASVVVKWNQDNTSTSAYYWGTV